MVGLARKAVRSAHDGCAVNLAEDERDAIGGCWLVMPIVMNVAGNEEIETPVSIVIAEGCAVRPVTQTNSRFFAYVSECAVVIVVVQTVIAVIGNKDIRPAIVVKVADGHAEAPSVVRDTRFGCHIGKGPVVVVVEERGMRRSLLSAQCIVG